MAAMELPLQPFNAFTSLGRPQLGGPHLEDLNWEDLIWEDLNCVYPILKEDIIYWIHCKNSDTGNGLKGRRHDVCS